MRPGAGPGGADGAGVDGDDGLECAICYAYHLAAAGDEEEGGGLGGGGGGPRGPADANPTTATTNPNTTAPATPTEHCPNPRCGRAFHAACVRGWLATLAGARAALGRLSGPCPYCGGGVSVALAVSGGE